MHFHFFTLLHDQLECPRQIAENNVRITLHDFAISVRRIIAVGRLCQLVCCVIVVQYYVQICFVLCCVTNGQYEDRLYVPLV